MFASSVKRFLSDASRAAAIEHGLVAALLALAIIGGAHALGANVGLALNTTTNAK